MSYKNLNINNLLATLLSGDSKYKPVKSITDLEAEYWKLTAATDKEQQFITDGEVYYDLTPKFVHPLFMQSHGTTYVSHCEVSNFIKERGENKHFIWEHTHPHTEIDGSICYNLRPPSMSDFYHERIASSDKKSVECRVNERHGIWVFRANKEIIEEMNAIEDMILNVLETVKCLPLNQQLKIIMSEYKKMHLNLEFTPDSEYYKS